MIKKEMSIKRCLIAASMAGTMVLSSIPAVPVFAADTVLATARFYGDYIYVEGGYSFYTTTKPTAKKIPASDKWTYLREGGLDISNSKKATTYYFAETPNPSNLSEIVAVSVGKKEATTKVTYKAGSLDVAKTATDKAKTRNENARKMFDGATGLYYYMVPSTYERDYESGSGSFDPDTNGNGGLQADDLFELQRVGGTVYFYKPSDVTDTTDEIEIKSVDSTTGMLKADFSTIKRPTVEKAVKVAKATKGPAVKIDYANHTLTLKKGNSVKEIDEYDEAYNEYVSGTEANEWTEIKDKSKSIDISNGARYAVKTVKDKKADSLPTFVEISASANASFKSTGSGVAIVGEYNNPAVLFVQSKDSATDAEAFQYTITDKIGDLYTTAGDFSYAAAAKLKWKSVKTKKDTKIGSTNLAWKNVEKKYVVVRKAAVGSNYSSKVVIFEAPNDATDTWSFIASHEYSTAENKTSFKASGDAHRSVKLYIDYDGTATASADAFTFDVESGENNIFANNTNGKIAAKLITGKSVTAKVDNKTYKKIEYTAEKISKAQLPVKTSATDVEFSFPKGAIQYTINGKTVDAPAMKITTKYGGSDKTEPIALSENLEANTPDPDDSGSGKTTKPSEKEPEDEDEDTTAPQIDEWDSSLGTKGTALTITADSTGTFTVHFNEKVRKVSGETEFITSNIGTYSNTNLSITDVSLGTDEQTVTITIANSSGSNDRKINYKGEVTFTIKNFEDLSGNPMSTTNATYTCEEDPDA